MDVADRVRAARDLHGWSMSELARRAKLKPQTISRIERGESTEDKLAARTVVAIAVATGVAIRWIVTGEGPMLRTTYRSPVMDRIADLVRQMTDEEAEQVLAFSQWTLAKRPPEQFKLTVVPRPD